MSLMLRLDQVKKEREALRMFRRICAAEGTDLSRESNLAVHEGVAKVLVAMVADGTASTMSLHAMLLEKMGIFAIHLLAPAMRVAGNFRPVQIGTRSAGNDDGSGAG
jgi:hypothetical protein